MYQYFKTRLDQYHDCVPEYPHALYYI